MTVLSNSPLPAGVPVSRTRARVPFLISALDSPRSERSRPDGRPIDATPAPGVAGDACLLFSRRRPPAAGRSPRRERERFARGSR